MVETSDINVQINNKTECIYKNTFKNEGNDLNSLIYNLKSMQQKVNDILTKLVQAEQGSQEVVADDNESEGDDSDDEDETPKPKKCKFK